MATRWNSPVADVPNGQYLDVAGHAASGSGYFKSGGPHPQLQGVAEPSLALTPAREPSSKPPKQPQRIGRRGSRVNGASFKVRQGISSRVVDADADAVGYLAM